MGRTDSRLHVWQGRGWQGSELSATDTELAARGTTASGGSAACGRESRSRGLKHGRGRNKCQTSLIRETWVQVLFFTLRTMRSHWRILSKRIIIILCFYVTIPCREWTIRGVWTSGNQRLAPVVNLRECRLGSLDLGSSSGFGDRKWGLLVGS